jgi:hypothetical protein
MMNKSLRARAPESSRNHFYGFQRPVFRTSPDAPAPECELRKSKGFRQFDDFDAAFRSRWDHSGDDAKKRAAVSGGF